MTRIAPIRGEQAFANPCAICTSAPPSPKSCIFCTYKIASHLHILHVLKAPYFHGFARFCRLSPAFSAHLRLPGGDTPHRTAQPATPSPARKRVVRSLLEGSVGNGSSRRDVEPDHRGLVGEKIPLSRLIRRNRTRRQGVNRDHPARCCARSIREGVPALRAAGQDVVNQVGRGGTCSARGAQVAQVRGEAAERGGV